MWGCSTATPARPRTWPTGRRLAPYHHGGGRWPLEARPRRQPAQSGCRALAGLTDNRVLVLLAVEPSYGGRLRSPGRLPCCPPGSLPHDSYSHRRTTPRYLSTSATNPNATTTNPPITPHGGVCGGGVGHKSPLHGRLPSTLAVAAHQQTPPAAIVAASAVPPSPTAAGSVPHLAPRKCRYLHHSRNRPSSAAPPQPPPSSPWSRPASTKCPVLADLGGWGRGCVGQARGSTSRSSPPATGKATAALQMGGQV